jgi:hypothetical protein
MHALHVRLFDTLLRRAESSVASFTVHKKMKMETTRKVSSVLCWAFRRHGTPDLGEGNIAIISAHMMLLMRMMLWHNDKSAVQCVIILGDYFVYSSSNRSNTPV